MTTNKMTNKAALTFVLDNCDIPSDVREKLENILASISKPHVSRKPTPKQRENEEYRAHIFEFLKDHPKQAFTCTEIGNNMEELADMTSQRISAMLRALVNSEMIVKTSKGGKSYFSIDGTIPENDFVELPDKD